MKPRFLTLVVLIVLNACHASPGNQYYALSPSFEAAPEMPRSPASLTISKVTIPGLLDRPQIILKSGSNEIRVLEYNRWAEPLDSMVRRVLADDLAALTANTRSNKRIAVTLDEFDADETGQVILKATWAVAGVKLSKHYTFQKNRTANGSDIDSIVTAMSQLLGDLAQAIVRHPG